jgi:hypothetical protein
MNRLRLMTSGLAALSLLVFSPALVSAQTTEPSTTTTNTTTTTTTTDTTKPAETPQSETSVQRIERYKKTYNTKLTAADQSRYKLKCKAAQVRSKAFLTSLENKTKSRAAAYKKITTKLDELTTKLKDTDYDTKELESSIAQLKKLIATYETDLLAYKNALTDMSNVDCVTDPVAFKASLDAARAQRQAVNKDAVEIRTYIEVTIKKSLKDAKDSLSKTSTAPANKEEDQQ